MAPSALSPVNYGQSGCSALKTAATRHEHSTTPPCVLSIILKLEIYTYTLQIYIECFRSDAVYIYSRKIDYPTNVIIQLSDRKLMQLPNAYARAVDGVRRRCGGGGFPAFRDNSLCMYVCCLGHPPHILDVGCWRLTAPKQFNNISCDIVQTVENGVSNLVLCPNS